MTFHQRTIDVARGKWRGILLELGLPSHALTGKHGPCPLCGGKDRFRWTNNEGSGGYYCSQCGSGSGMDLAKAYTGQEFAAVASRIDQLVGNLKQDAPSRNGAMTDEQRVAYLKRLYRESAPVQAGDVADRYLRSRGIHNATYPDSIRFSPRSNDGQGGVHPAMFAMVGVYGQPKFCSIHRTFLKPDGSGKAEITPARKLSPGPLDDGCCVALSDYTGGALGVAEGIETAMSASAIYDMPVWAVINTSMMRKWSPPDGCGEVVIFGDCDPLYGGQSAAYDLAHRLAVAGVGVEVQIPPDAGKDWNDVLVGYELGDGA